MCAIKFEKKIVKINIILSNKIDMMKVMNVKKCEQ